MLTHLCQKPESLIRVRTEFDKVITEMYPDEKSSSKRDQLDRLVKTDSLMEMEYLNMIMQEALRFEPPAPQATPIIISQDLKVGKWNLKKGDTIMNNITGIHHNSKQW